MHALHKSRIYAGNGCARRYREEPDPPHSLSLLRTRGEWPSSHRAAEERNELAPLHARHEHFLLRGSSRPTKRITPHATAGHRCTAGFRPGLGPRWVIRVGVSLGRTSIHVRSTPDSDRKFKALLPIVMCQIADGLRWRQFMDFHSAAAPKHDALRRSVCRESEPGVLGRYLGRSVAS